MEKKTRKMKIYQYKLSLFFNIFNYEASLLSFIYSCINLFVDSEINQTFL